MLSLVLYVLVLKHEFKMEMSCEGCSNAAKRVLAKIGGMLSTPVVCLSYKLIAFCL